MTRKFLILLLLLLSSILAISCSRATPTPIVIVVTATPPPAPTTAVIKYPAPTTAVIKYPTATDIQEEAISAPQQINLPPGAFSWDEAVNHIGETITVCGPVMDSYYSRSSGGQPTFINIGREYPDPERFTVLVWGEDRANFPQSPETLYLGKTICATGKIKEYKGSAEMKVTNPSQITLP